MAKPAGIVRIFATAIAFLVVAGHAGSQAPGPSADAQAKSFVPSPDHATVYVYRNEHLGAIVRMAIAVDGKEVGITKGMTYLVLRLEPGQHSLVTQGLTRAPLVIEVVAGKNYYVWQEAKARIGTFTYRSRLHLVDEKVGQEGVRECELAVAEK